MSHRPDNDDLDEFTTPIRPLGRDARRVPIPGNSGVDYSDPDDHGLIRRLP